uniref:FYVE-type domain-containing protein n=1 Tax=Bursaphelenchus xylophilus TaxID=6326 RepID=A0A1I7SQ18_BURXY
MQSLRKLVNKPRVDDWSPLAKFYHADEALSAIANELDSFDGRRDPDRCNQLVNKLRQAQDRVLQIIAEMISIVFPSESERACRDYRAKFPDEIIHDNLPGQLWFGAECLAAGSNIVEHEAESEAIRPMARALTRHLDKMRNILKDQALRDPTVYTPKIKASLHVFDRLFAEFEFNYVSAMVPVKTIVEYDHQLDVAVLFAECLNRALETGYFSKDQIEDADPTVMIALPRIAILWGLTTFEGNALDLNQGRENISEMFRHFYDLLKLIRTLLNLVEDENQILLENYLITGIPEERRTLRENDISASALTTSKLDDKNHILHAALNDMSNFELTDEFVTQAKKNIDDVIHRLFVCICGVADQLQTNYSSDIRKILKMVLQPVETRPIYEISGKTAAVPQNIEETGVEVQESISLPTTTGVEWVPDADCDNCVACGSAFTLVRRRHHCRNCGRIFCYRCSGHALALPELGYERPVRVCNICFLYKINPFTPCTSDGLTQTSRHIEDNNELIPSTSTQDNFGTV